MPLTENTLKFFNYNVVNNPKNIIISRADSIGDVMLTLPLCGMVKKHFPKCKLTFIGRSYTKEVIGCCEHVDNFLNWDELTTEQDQIKALEKIAADTIIHAFPNKEIVVAAYKAKIKNRVATGRRKHTFRYCNKKVWFSRKKSDLHESQLNLKLLKPLGISSELSLSEIQKLYGFTRFNDQSETGNSLLNSNKKNIVLHTKSKGSAVEWPMEKFNALIELMPPEKYHFILSGTEAEGKLIRDKISWSTNVVDGTGKLSLKEFIAFLKRVDFVVAGSTGPLHIASALETNVLGLYSPARPIHPGRWMPVGVNAHYLVNENPILNGPLQISEEDVYRKIEEVLSSKSSLGC